ncbi:MAG: hypothetical protein QOE36_1217, partial [Gaiellaceae bacterium]|nr:hypothetical protein [Gaiellaceae bacterium]
MSPLLFKRVPDERLCSRLAAGEAAAFDELYKRYVHRLAAYGGHLLGDLAAGEDVAQAALLNAYQALRSGRIPENVRPWLYRIAHNAALDVLARRRELLRADPGDGVAAREEEFGTRGALLEALTALPDRQRRAYVLREVHGLRVSEIATELRLTGAQVEQALFAARNRLAEHLLFGGRLECDVVRRLAAGSLDITERRALKSHMRGCSGCRSAVGRRVAGVAALLPLPSLDWLRGLAGPLFGGGAAPAVKVGAVLATTALAAGVPLAAHEA